MPEPMCNFSYYYSGGKMSNRRCLSLLLVLCLLPELISCAAKSIDDGRAEQIQKVRIEKLDDLPRHMYKVPDTAVKLMNDEAQFRDFLTKFEADLILDLEKYDITDKTTVKNFYALLTATAMIEDRYDDALKYIQLRREMEDKPDLKLTTGITASTIIRARQQKEMAFEEAFRAELKASLEKLPYNTVANVVKEIKSGTEIMSENLFIGIILEKVEPAAKSGEISRDLAETLIYVKMQMKDYLQLKDIIVEEFARYIAANDVKKPDIWAKRDFSLMDEKPENLKPVNIAIWDSGLDVAVFKDNLWRNIAETPGNDKDDDLNGFVDDVNGIGFDLHSNKIKDVIYVMDCGPEEVEQGRLFLKGFTDLSANLDTREASELKKHLSSLPADKVKPFIESISRYSIYVHGTHVGGIAVNGNPAAKLLVARMTYDYHMLPELPTVEQARRDAWAMAETVAYFKNNGVRVVNMSWGGDLRSIEIALEQHNSGGSPEERKMLAREIYKIVAEALYEAIRKAPEILFITSAGNSNNDVSFEEFYPSSFELPNIISVGAVDQAGGETTFTSFGKVDVYANGFEVDSFVPGGDRMKLSGTSMSSPQVANLAGKLLALKPELSVAELRAAIIDNAGETEITGGRKIKLLNPQASMKAILTPEE